MHINVTKAKSTIYDHNNTWLIDSSLSAFRLSPDGPVDILPDPKLDNLFWSFTAIFLQLLNRTDLVNISTALYQQGLPSEKIIRHNSLGGNDHKTKSIHIAERNI